MQLVVHAPFGGAREPRLRPRAAQALLRHRSTSSSRPRRPTTPSSCRWARRTASRSPTRSTSCAPTELDATLEQAVLAGADVRRRAGAGTRRARSRSCGIERGKKVPPFLQRMRAEDLLAAVFPAQVACQENATGPVEIPDHPLVRQTVRDCLTEAMDAERLRGVLERIERGEIRLHARDTTEPSPFSHEILNAKPYAFLDDAPLEERRARARLAAPHAPRAPAGSRRARRRRRSRASSPRRDPSRATPTSCTTCCSGWSRRPSRTPGASGSTSWSRAGRAAVVATAAGRWRSPPSTPRTVEALYSGRRRAAARLPPHLDGPAPRATRRVLAIVRGHAEVAGPFTVAALAARARARSVGGRRRGRRALEGEGVVLRGRFTPGGDDERGAAAIGACWRGSTATRSTAADARSSR